MKTKKILYTTMSNNIGQVKIENAQKEIDRLNKQKNTDSWRTDDSPFIFVKDETDDDVNNPCERIEGFVWITCEPTSTRKQAIAWWNNLSDGFEKGSKFQILHNFLDSNKMTGFSSKEGRMIDTLTGREIEEIYDKEVLEPKRQKEWQESQVNCRYSKPNQKQFKQFDKSLHKEYLNKFSEEDKFKAFISNLNELSKEIQFNAFLTTLKKMNLDSQTQSNIMTLVALRDI